MSELEIDSRITVLEARLKTATADYDESLDTIWMLVCAMLVFFMHSGFSLLEAAFWGPWRVGSGQFRVEVEQSVAGQAARSLGPRKCGAKSGALKARIRT